MPCDEGRWRLLNPLTIRFSQPRIAPHFRDGHLLEDTVTQVGEAPLESGVVDLTSLEAAEGPPPYDTVLMPPFPAIRVISWLPKIRRPDGGAERTKNGEQILGKRAWFALDNRRLHSLQFAAAKRWPRRCCVAVRCIEEVPGTTIRELRKFRTTTEGRSIEVGMRTGETLLWNWSQAAPPGAKLEVLEAEGLFAEDLWDAVQWAPQAVALGSAGTSPEDEDLREAPAKGPVTTGRESHQPRARIANCPEMGWQYVDPSGKVQGPFTLEKMRLWHQHGYFFPELPMRCEDGDIFVPFAQLFPAPLQPFCQQVIKYSQ